MNNLKKALIAICVAVVLIAVCVIIVLRPIPTIPTGELLYEDEPAENALRTSTQVDGVGGSRFFIQSPKDDALTGIYVSAFGAYPENEDNVEQLNNALTYCRNNPGTRLIFDDGVYYVSDRLHFDDLNDILVDGNGAKIMTSFGSGLVDINNSNCLEIRNLTIDWDWNKRPLSTLASAVDVKGEAHTLDFIFDDPEFCDVEMFYALTQCDANGNTYGEKGTLIEFYNEQRDSSVFKQLTKTSDNTIRMVHNGALDRFGGNKFILRSTAYGGAVLHIQQRSSNITLNGVKIYGGSGMGMVIGERSSHFALRNVFIGPDPNYADKHFTSLGADAVHISDSDGCFVIEGCDFSRQGDDDVNINSGIGWIKSVDGKTVTFEADGSMRSDIGDGMLFRDPKFNLISNFKAVIESCEYFDGGVRKVTFSEKLPKSIKAGGFCFNADCTGSNYVIRNNYFHEHRARGLLLQTSDGLVENNHFYKTTHNAIKIVMDINGVWHEGTGADNIVIRNNVFEQCGYIGPEVIEIGTKLLDQSIGSYAFTNIVIENNEFKELCGNLMVVNNVNNFVFNDNTITVGSVFRNDVGQGRAWLLSDCANVNFYNNTYTDAPKLSLKRIVRCDNPLVWIRMNVIAKKGGAK